MVETWAVKHLFCWSVEDGVTISALASLYRPCLIKLYMNKTAPTRGTDFEIRIVRLHNESSRLFSPLKIALGKAILTIIHIYLALNPKLVIFHSQEVLHS